MQDKNKQEKDNTGDKINDFIQRNRKVIFAVSGVIVILFIGAVVYFALNDSMSKKAAGSLEDLTARYDELKTHSHDDGHDHDGHDHDIDEHDHDLDGHDHDGEIDAFLDELKVFAGKTRGISGSKAWAMAAEIYTERKDWALAEEAFISSARAGEKTYLGPLSYFNAAAAAEEQGKYEDAVELLQKALSLKIEFPSAPRAQFAIGRLYEKLDNTSLAIAAYREVMDKWQELPAWQQLAQSRITALETK